MSSLSLKRCVTAGIVLALPIWIFAVDASAAEAASGERELGTIASKQLDEISGMAASHRNAHVLWIHNDGDAQDVFAINEKGKVLTRIKPKVPIDDIEDIAIGPGPIADTDYLYLGDIGDNDLRRREIRVVRVPEPNLAGRRNKKMDVETVEEFRLVYPDGPHNAESLLVEPTSGEIFIVTKENSRARLYTVAAEDLNEETPVVLRFAGSAAAMDVSSGDISPDGNWIVLRREDVGWLWNRASGESIVAAFQRPSQMVPVRGKRQGPNGEAVAFSPGGKSYYTVSEGEKQTICEFDLPAMPSALVR